MAPPHTLGLTGHGVSTSSSSTVPEAFGLMGPGVNSFNFGNINLPGQTTGFPVAVSNISGATSSSLYGALSSTEVSAEYIKPARRPIATLPRRGRIPSVNQASSVAALNSNTNKNPDNSGISQSTLSSSTAPQQPLGLMDPGVSPFNSGNGDLYQQEQDMAHFLASLKSSQQSSAASSQSHKTQTGAPQAHLQAPIWTSNSDPVSANIAAWQPPRSRLEHVYVTTPQVRADANSFQPRRSGQSSSNTDATRYFDMDAARRNSVPIEFNRLAPGTRKLDEWFDTPDRYLEEAASITQGSMGYNNARNPYSNDANMEVAGLGQGSSQSTSTGRQVGTGFQFHQAQDWGFHNNQGSHVPSSSTAHRRARSNMGLVNTSGTGLTRTTIPSSEMRSSIEEPYRFTFLSSTVTAPNFQIHPLSIPTIAQPPRAFEFAEPLNLAKYNEQGVSYNSVQGQEDPVYNGSQEDTQVIESMDIASQNHARVFEMEKDGMKTPAYSGLAPVQEILEASGEFYGHLTDSRHSFPATVTLDQAPSLVSTSLPEFEGDQRIDTQMDGKMDGTDGLQGAEQSNNTPPANNADELRQDFAPLAPTATPDFLMGTEETADAMSFGEDGNFTKAAISSTLLAAHLTGQPLREAKPNEDHAADLSRLAMASEPVSSEVNFGTIKAGILPAQTTAHLAGQPQQEAVPSADYPADQPWPVDSIDTWNSQSAEIFDIGSGITTSGNNFGQHIYAQIQSREVSASDPADIEEDGELDWLAKSFQSVVPNDHSMQDLDTGDKGETPLSSTPQPPPQQSQGDTLVEAASDDAMAPLPAFEGVNAEVNPTDATPVPSATAPSAAAHQPVATAEQKEHSPVNGDSGTGEGENSSGRPPLEVSSSPFPSPVEPTEPAVLQGSDNGSTMAPPCASPEPTPTTSHEIPDLGSLGVQQGEVGEPTSAEVLDGMGFSTGETGNKVAAQAQQPITGLSDIESAGKPKDKKRRTIRRPRQGREERPTMGWPYHRPPNPAAHIRPSRFEGKIVRHSIPTRRSEDIPVVEPVPPTRKPAAKDALKRLERRKLGINPPPYPNRTERPALLARLARFGAQEVSEAVTAPTNLREAPKDPLPKAASIQVQPAPTTLPRVSQAIVHPQPTPVGPIQAVQRDATPQPTRARNGGLFGHPARIEGTHTGMPRGQALPFESKPVARVDPITALLRLRPLEEPEEEDMDRRHRRNCADRKRKRTQQRWTRRQDLVVETEEMEEEPEAVDIRELDPILTLRGFATMVAMFGAGLFLDSLVGRWFGV
ncbi:hypothetical protein JR316_0006148 [Psilocybe cubensis]|uniref:Uncharacterized protein n=1 Tax=Psilocybe cubensis TaxID=181762 RepID=A0ACB8H1B2_PSICU|nr:hypothetical protein JR316_0006148 [Psilocybe cubensis]KAH9481621.1 hypothetical protein JR316_0006148 [Psilocybe cubensis]